MLRWHVEYWGDGVVYVEVFGDGWSHRLQGHDHYWVTPEAFGMFNTSKGYTGRQACAWEVMPDGWPRYVGEVQPPDGVQIHDGIWLPDEIAASYGLI